MSPVDFVFFFTSNLLMTEEYSQLVQSYYTNPVHNYVLDTFSYTHHEWNSVCGDDITIYVTLDMDNNKIIDYWFDGNCSLITKAAASFLADLIIGESISTVLQRNYATLVNEWFEVSFRRRRAVVLALLAIKNWYYLFVWVQKREEFDDLLDG